MTIAYTTNWSNNKFQENALSIDGTIAHILLKNLYRENQYMQNVLKGYLYRSMNNVNYFPGLSYQQEMCIYI